MAILIIVNLGKDRDLEDDLENRDSAGGSKPANSTDRRTEAPIRTDHRDLFKPADPAGPSGKGPYTKVEALAPEFVENIQRVMSPISHPEEREGAVKSWYDGVMRVNRHIGHALHISDPTLVYIGADHIYYSHTNHPDFSEGSAIRKEDGMIFEWELKQNATAIGRGCPQER